MTGAALELDAVQALRGGRPLAAPVRLRLEPGAVLGVVGPNGAGKSSLLAAIARSGIRSSGAVRYGGAELAALSARQRARTVSLLAQDSRAPDELRVGELVGIGARAGGRGGTAEALAALGIEGLADRRVGTLSGGQRQLAQLARVLAQATPVVVLDEPTSALDLAHQGVVERALRGLAEQGRIVILAVHDLSLALNACTEILLLGGDGGHHHGSPAEVLRPETVHAVYGVRTTVHTTSGGRSFLAPADAPHREEPS